MKKVPSDFETDNVDAGINNVKFVYRDWILSTYLDIQNVTNRSNSEGLNYNYDYSESQVTSGAPVLPTFGLKAEF